MTNILPGNFHHQIFFQLFIFITPKEFLTLYTSAKENVNLLLKDISTKDMRMSFPHFMTMTPFFTDATMGQHTLNSIPFRKLLVRATPSKGQPYHKMTCPNSSFLSFLSSFLLLDHTLVILLTLCPIMEFHSHLAVMFLKGSEKLIPYKVYVIDMA